VDHAVRIWATIDRLTKASQVRTDRDPDPVEAWDRGRWCSLADHQATVSSHGVVPSLWRQAVGAICGRDSELTGPGGDPSLRDPYDLALWDLCVRIRDTTVDELRHLRQPPGWGTESNLRRLAATVVSRNLDLEQWDWRFTMWTVHLETHLGMLSRANKPLLLRSAPCPTCHVRTLTVDREDGQRVVEPVLEVTFHNGYARAVTCRACGHEWGRGEPMHQLAEALGVTVATATVGA
jgi:hypothetical protein